MSTLRFGTRAKLTKTPWVNFEMDKDDISPGCEIAFEDQNVISEQDDMILEEVTNESVP